MNLKKGIDILSFKDKYVSGIMVALLVASSLVILLPFSSDNAMGYTMPVDVTWNMEDLVTNSSGAVTSSGVDEFVVHEDVAIPVNSSLYVYPGETIYFNLGTGFTVYGYLSATGNDTSYPTFTSSEVNPSYGDWDGIYFDNAWGEIDGVSVSYAENGIYLNNTPVSILNSEFTSNVWGIRLNYGEGEISGNSFIDNGILPHPYPSLSVGGGIYSENSYYGYFLDNYLFQNIGGIRVESGYTYAMYNELYNNTVYGIYLSGQDNWNQSYMNIMNNEIMSNENFGIYSEEGSSPYISYNNITFNRVGIYIESGMGPTGGGGSIYDNLIAHNLDNGIECYGSSSIPPPDPGTSISGNQISSNGDAGIFCQNSSAYIQENEITGNWFGVFALDSTPEIRGCFFDSNRNAIWANASDVDVIDCNIIKSNPIDFTLESDSYVISLNTTFDDHSAIFYDDLSILEVRWYLHVVVVNGSGPVDSADVTVTDNENGTWSQGFVTGSDGRVKWIEVVEYIRDSTSWVFYTPHNITVTKGSQVGYEEPIMDISKFVVVNIGDGVPPIGPLPPIDLDILLLGSDLQLSWGASGDDGAGANDVVSYEIYRSSSVNGPYVNVGSVVADGSPSYTWTDSGKGDGEWNNYFYIVRAKDADELEDDNENKVGKFVSSLDTEWNMISTPLSQVDTSREKVLETLGNNYASVHGYHAGKSRPWLNWRRDKPNRMNDVIHVNQKEGYYIDMMSADYLVNAGKVEGTVNINLKAGWNLVGYPCLTEKLRDDALSSISGKYNKVERYDTNANNEVRLDPGDYMQPGLGYWIHATQDCVWTITN